MKYNDYTEDSFHVGQVVIAVDAYPMSHIKNGNEYIVSSWEFKMNPVNGLWFWYIGIEGIHDWLRPGIFAPKPKFKRITLSEVLETETEFISAN